MSDELRKPRCFGDPDEHSMTSPRCRSCPVRQSCGIMTKNALLREERRRSERPTPPSTATHHTTQPHISRAPDPEDYIERADEGAGFFGALFFNAALSAFRAGLVEATFASDQIPRFPYPDPFRGAFKRARREEDE